MGTLWIDWLGDGAVRLARTLLKSTHPVPSVSVALVSVLFGIGLGLKPSQVVFVGLAVLLQQFSVGLSNDWLDSARDEAVERVDKPVALGLIAPRIVRNWSFVCALAAVLTALLLGVIPALWMLLMLAIGWAYNLGMKSNWSSVLAYAAGFGILPVFVTLSQQPPSWPPAWIVSVAALLGISAHFANVLPDLFEDRATGVRALPHLLGQRASAVVISVTATSASLIVATQSPALSHALGWLGFGVTVALAGTASVLALRPRPPRIVFPLLILASLTNVVMLMLGIGD